MAIRYGNQDVSFGVPEGIDPNSLRYEGFPEGAKIRLRLRPDEFAQAFARTRDGRIYWYYVGFRDGVCTPHLSKGCNLVVTVEPGIAPKPRRIIRRLEPIA